MSKKKAPPTPNTGKSRDDIFGRKKPQIEEVVVTAPIEQDAPPSLRKKEEGQRSTMLASTRRPSLLS